MSTRKKPTPTKTLTDKAREFVAAAEKNLDAARGELDMLRGQRAQLDAQIESLDQRTSSAAAELADWRRCLKDAEQ